MTLDVSGLNAWYGPAHILFDVAFTVRPGEVVALLGRNGAGKSTAFRAVMGLLARRCGKVVLNGRDLSGAAPHEVAKAGLGYVPEDRRIFTELTVAGNLEVGRQPPRTGAPTWTPERLYELFPSLGTMRNRPGGRMSGGEQQMLTIARTLMGNPSLVLLDEPAEGLAPKVVADVADAMRVLKGEGLGIILSEQNFGFTRAVADRAVLLERGRVRFDGPVAALDAAATRP